MEQRFVTILIDPNTFFREGLAAVLAKTRFEPQERLASLQEMDRIGLDGSPRMFFLVDFGPDADAAADGVRALKTRHPNCFLLILRDRHDHPHMRAVLRAGADGYLVKTMSPEALLRSLDLAVLGEPVFPAAALDFLAGEAVVATKPDRADMGAPRPLSAREADILNCLTRGETNKMIARRFGIAEATVKVHIKAILRKIQVKNRTQAAIWARDHGASPEAFGEHLAAQELIAKPGEA